MNLILNPYSGASGDMMMAALAELSDAHEALTAFVTSSVPVTIEHKVEIRNGITYRRILVAESHEHLHHVTMSDIRKMFSGKAQNEQIYMDALSVFEMIADAEAKVHGVPVDRVHFHEVGAWDSIADVLGTCFLVDRLRRDGVSAIYTYPLGCGHGTIQSAHGEISNPAPATLEIMASRDMPCTNRNTTSELVTPTAAALIAHFAAPLPEGSTYRVVRSVRATGTREWKEIPSFFEARLVAGEVDTERLICIETNIDDMTGEEVGILPNMLVKKGALDAWIEQGIGKKNRPMFVVKVLCAQDMTSALEDLLLEETTSLGVRRTSFDRRPLPRSMTVLTTSLGDVRVKYNRFRLDLAKPEMDDILSLAERNALPVIEVRRIVCSEITDLLREKLTEEES